MSLNNFKHFYFGVVLLLAAKGLNLKPIKPTLHLNLNTAHHLRVQKRRILLLHCDGVVEFSVLTLISLHEHELSYSSCTFHVNRAFQFSLKGQNH